MTDERDLHDPTLDAAWRAHVQDAPPRALDDAILAAAHRAVQSGPRAAGAASARWKAWAPLAVAVTVGAIALGVLQLAPREEDATRAVVSDAPVASMQQRAETERQAPTATTAPAPAPVERAASSSATAPATPAAPKPAGPKSEVAQRRLQAPAPAVGGRFAEAPVDKLSKQRDASVQDEAPRQEKKEDRIAQEQAFLARKDAPAPSPQPFPASPPPPPASVPAPAFAPPAGGVTAAAPASPAARSAGALTAQSAAPLAARERDVAGADARAKVATTRSPDDFIREIHRLRAEGRDADATLALAAFRAAYPDADQRLPDDLRAWARGVPRS
jgi:hypothetical protein